MKKIDAHVHICNPITVQESEYYLRDMMERKGLCSLGIMALARDSREFYPYCNEVAAELKRRMPELYIFASLHYHLDFVEQAKEYMERGFDGIKLLNGKPSVYRYFGSGYETEAFDRFFAYAEEQQIPLMIHNNDPRANWDPDLCSEGVKKMGWYYGDGNLPAQEEFFCMMEAVLERHPKLRAAIAHMGFYYDNLPRAATLLKRYPNLFFDMTPGIEIYKELSEDADNAKAFISKYHERLIYGTDADNDLTPGGRVYRVNNAKTEVMDVFFEGTEECMMTPGFVEAFKVVPMHLEKYMVENIYYYNFLRFMRKSGEEKEK